MKRKKKVLKVFNGSFLSNVVGVGYGCFNFFKEGSFVKKFWDLNRFRSNIQRKTFTFTKQLLELVPIVFLVDNFIFESKIVIFICIKILIKPGLNVIVLTKIFFLGFERTASG